MLGLQELLLNFLFLIVFLLFIPIISELNCKLMTYRKKKWIYIISASLAIISCMSFPIPVMDGYFFDLRLVALTIAGLYGGIPSILILGGVIIICRFIIGGLGATATIIVITLLTILLSTMYKSFNQSTRTKKVILGTALSLTAAILALLNSIFIFSMPFSATLFFLYIILTIISTALLIYFSEVFNESLFINKRLAKAEKLEVVSHLASSVSHEVRNPLTVVKGFLQLMMQNDLPDSQRKGYLKIAIDEVNRANEIISDYLTFAKPAPENVKTLNIKEEIQHTLNLILPLANMKGVKVETELEEVYTKGDDQLFQQCLLNITKNCIEAMPATGTLKINAEITNEQIMLIISDNGKGMTKEQLARLGEPYFTTKGSEGTGLGMMVAIKIIASMNGKLSVKSEVNKGTNFYIRLPYLK
ncbi:ATP-binding protein [Evansella cellulosilytica]|uniref:histidine kinase n=1 Tax=Evansella cellulosilytica (strain ATCC 21833 / DSM 2522 / FERM P-1141 / JCM 9156 / N-4) TaxID=649639 RepID=E6TZ39_EVAC2|nr:ATP-binding protein [Evansella cellulosilytica]ADU32482.1 integral membrane sensor signal transduction histidine kinase [Evansella cellulosilytica DSM 2522]